MSQENVEVVRRHFEAWNRHDMATLSTLWRADAEIDWSRARGPLKGVYRGRGERETFWNEFYSTLSPHTLRRRASLMRAPKLWSPSPPAFGGARGSR